MRHFSVDSADRGPSSSLGSWVFSPILDCEKVRSSMANIKGSKGDRMLNRAFLKLALFVLFLGAPLLLAGCSLPLKVIDTTANAITKTATTTIQTTGNVMKAGMGLAGNAANRLGGAAPLAAALAARPVEPTFVP